MSDIENVPTPAPLPPVLDPAATPAVDNVEPSRLDLLEGRIAALEAQLLAASTTEEPARPSLSTDGVANWLRNNPVMAVIAVIVLLILFSHIMD